MSVTKLDITRQATFSGDTAIGSHKLTGLTDPTSAQDAATKAYVDSMAAGLSWKTAVRAASTTNGALSSAYANSSVLDGITLATGDRILLKDQTTGSENGIYTVNASGAPTRSTDANSSTNFVDNTAVFVEQGTVNADTGWTCTNDGTITPGTTAITFGKFTGASGGTVTSVSVASANGFSGTVATATTTPAITLQTTVTGLLKGNGTAISAATSSTDYAPATSGTAILKGNGSGGFSSATAGTDYMAPTDFVVRETPTGSVNGSNTSFVLANTPLSGTEEVYLNGILQEPGAGNDYTISSGTITYLTAPLSGDRLRVTYQK